MRWFLVVSLLVCFCRVPAQEDFISLYGKMSQVRVWQKEQNTKIGQTVRNMSKENLKDSSKVKALLRNSYNSILDSVLAVARQVINLSFPDINFTSSTGKIYALSDFINKDIILSYSYFFCDVCLTRTDSIVKLIADRPVQVIALFSDEYKQEPFDPGRYKKNVIVGFINEENRNFISLTFGDNFTYYLDKNRQIEFFNKLYGKEEESAWYHFLMSHK